MKHLLLFFFLISSLFLFGQRVPTQAVRGSVFDNESKFPIVGAKVVLFSEGFSSKTITDFDGLFLLENVPVGKHEIQVSYTLYSSNTLTVEVSSGKEVVVQVPLVEFISEQKEVVVHGRKRGEVLNELALISAQQFSVEETNRYPGSRMDPARMASNFAGVQGADDSRNDIIIRGNSPLGVVWRVEGVDIPNPSHFAISGSTGGPVSIINNKILANSDFFMSAFPAEYGNSTSGVFDLKLRNGNNNRHEFTGQFGFLGTEFLAEGPLSKKNKSSYLVMGRYSTLSLFQQVGIQLGTDAVPQYGDASFKFNFPLKKGGQLSWFGIGGKSNINILISEQTEYSTEFYGEGDRDQKFGTSMYITGLNFKKPLSPKTFVSATAAVSYEEQHSRHDYLQRSLSIQNEDTTISVDTSYLMMGYNFSIIKTSGHFSLNHKINKKNLVKTGVNIDVFSLFQNDSVLYDLDAPDNFKQRWDYSGNRLLVQPFVQWKFRANDNLDFTFGLHSQYFSNAKSFSPVEPRTAIKYRLPKNQSVFAGAGLHSQMQPLYTYSYHQIGGDGSKIYQNEDMGLMKSIHTGLGYEKAFNQGFSIKTEAYYQHLYQVPVTVAPSSFSIINMGSGFARLFPDSLENTGTGLNYGIELTVQKYFNKSFFFLFSGTLYDSKYRGSDNVLRNTSYNGSYVVNFLTGKEFNVGKNNVIGLGLKTTRAGGKRYGYVNVEATEELKEIIFQDSLFNERQFADY
ncbi:MAG: carboxypeptidase-like regulatory domain-containing protein, partial [Crocinitomicaceae bacterium]|nr:carboxypeptidase-like regulatory domain-containing protein [Crocinitomicaceae bacterium]